MRNEKSYREMYVHLISKFHVFEAHASDHSSIPEFLRKPGLVWDVGVGHSIGQCAVVTSIVCKLQILLSTHLHKGRKKIDRTDAHGC